MKGSAHVEHLEGLRELEVGLRVFAARADEITAAFERELHVVLEWLGTRVVGCEHDVDELDARLRVVDGMLEDCYSTSGEGTWHDCSEREEAVWEARARLASAEERLALARRSLKAVEDAKREYDREALGFQELITEHAAATRAFVRQRREALEAYIGVRPSPAGLGQAETEGTVPSRLAAPRASGGGDRASREAQVAARQLRSIRGLARSEWSGLDVPERLRVLRDVETTMAKLHGRPPVLVVARPLPPTDYGGYTGNASVPYGDTLIVINAVKLEGTGASMAENLDTVVHEGRHAYQHFAVQHPGVHPDPEEVSRWRHNLTPGNYITGEYGSEQYFSQPIEADAWTYAQRVLEAFKNA